MSPKKRSSSAHRGYTILEMGVVVGLLTLISAVVVPDLQSIRFSSDLSIAASSVMQGVNTAKILAQSGKGGSDWGFSVPNERVFQGSTHAARNPAGDLSFDLPDTISASGLSEVTFSQLDGYINRTGVIILTALNGKSIAIVIDDQGIPTPTDVTDELEEQASQSSSASSVSSVSSSSSSSSSSVQVATSVTLTSSPNPSTYGSIVTLTATVVPSTLIGTVAFRDGSTTLGTASLASGVATLNVSSLIVGNHSLTAIYGSNNYTSNTSNTRIHTVNKASCTITLASSLNPATLGTSVRLTGAVSPSSATGTLTFKEGSTVLGTATLSSGSAYVDIASLTVGAHSLTVVYGGNSNVNSCTSSILVQSVTAVASSSSSVSSTASSVPASSAASSTSIASSSLASSAASSASSTLSSSASSVSSTASSSVSSASSSSSSSSSAGGVTWQSQNVGILLLDATSAGALILSGNGHLNISNANGTVTVNSSHAQAVQVSANGIVNATTLNVKGSPGRIVSGNGQINATINTNVLPSADPLASLTIPTPPSQSYSAVNLSGNNSLTINPGTYVGGITVSGNGRLTMNPGIYYLQGGGFKLSGNAIVTANGVMVYNAPSLSTDVISLSGNANLTISPMSSGIYAGVSVFQRRTSNLGTTISGNGIINLDGVFYAAASTLTLSGNGNVNLQCLPNPRFILNKLNFTSNGQFNVQ